ncbi:hypothetical protein C8R46DRAFT_1138251 [Mycena filopes]|nr:hypothetical protein C8R46DRAFT_1138251 [Mycena filopes]
MQPVAMASSPSIIVRSIGLVGSLSESSIIWFPVELGCSSSPKRLPDAFSFPQQLSRPRSPNRGSFPACFWAGFRSSTCPSRNGLSGSTLGITRHLVRISNLSVGKGSASVTLPSTYSCHRVATRLVVLAPVTLLLWPLGLSGSNPSGNHACRHFFTLMRLSAILPE